MRHIAYSNFHIIKCIDDNIFCAVIKTTKYLLWVVIIRPQTNPTWQTAAILKNPKPLYIHNGLTDFDEIWQDDATWTSTPQ